MRVFVLGASRKQTGDSERSGMLTVFYVLYYIASVQSDDSRILVRLVTIILTVGLLGKVGSFRQVPHLDATNLQSTELQMAIRERYIRYKDRVSHSSAFLDEAATNSS